VAAVRSHQQRSIQERGSLPQSCSVQRLDPKLR